VLSISHTAVAFGISICVMGPPNLAKKKPRFAGQILNLKTVFLIQNLSIRCILNY